MTPRTRPIEGSRLRSCPRLKCAHCDVLNGPRDGECRNCGEPLDPDDDAWEPDPDDARDAMMDRMLDQRWDSD